MKITKINSFKENAYASIKNSMQNKTEVSIYNGLDACGCTGNGNC